MAKHYEESIEDLKARVAGSDVRGEWSNDGKGKHMFRTKSGGVLNFWPNKGTLQFQGKPGVTAELEAIFEDSEVAKPTVARVARSTAGQHDSRPKIFVVHGHDSTALEQLELILHRLDLNPYILQNNDGQSKTIIEALEKQIYKEAAFGIILLTPDDYGYPKSDGEERRQPRARQNVILEMGMVLASLGRDRTVMLKKGALELPTDVSGIIYLEFNDHVKEVAVKLATQMKQSGINIKDSIVASAGA